MQDICLRINRFVYSNSDHYFCFSNKSVDDMFNGDDMSTLIDADSWKIFIILVNIFS